MTTVSALGRAAAGVAGRKRPEREVEQGHRPSRREEQLGADRVPDLHLMVPPLGVLTTDIHPVLGASLAGPRDRVKGGLVRRQRSHQLDDPRAGDFEQISQQPWAETAKCLDATRVQRVQPVDQIAWVAQRAIGREPVSVPVRRDLAQVAVEQVRGDIVHGPRPGRASDAATPSPACRAAVRAVPRAAAQTTGAV